MSTTETLTLTGLLLHCLVIIVIALRISCFVNNSGGFSSLQIIIARLKLNLL